ncbi:hypothetical protein [Streptomyces tubercidicus]
MLPALRRSFVRKINSQAAMAIPATTVTGTGTIDSVAPLSETLQKAAEVGEREG